MAKIDEVVAAYRKLRDQKSDMEDRHKEELAPIKGNMVKLEAWLQTQLNNSGSESVKTANGTVYISKTSSVKTDDWTTTLEYIVEHELWHMLEKRLSKAAVEQFVEEEKVNFPGTEITYMSNIRVRK